MDVAGAFTSAQAEHGFPRGLLKVRVVQTVQSIHIFHADRVRVVPIGMYDSSCRTRFTSGFSTVYAVLVHIMRAFATAQLLESWYDLARPSHLCVGSRQRRAHICPGLAVRCRVCLADGLSD